MQFRNMAELGNFVVEIATALWGDDKTRSNGLRSHVNDHEARLDTLEPIVTENRKKIDAHLEAHETMDEATKTLKTAALQVRGAVIAASISALASVAVAIIMAVLK